MELDYDEVQDKVKVMESYIKETSKEFKFLPKLFITSGLFVLFSVLLSFLLYNYIFPGRVLHLFFTILFFSVIAYYFEYIKFFIIPQQEILITRKHLIKIYFLTDGISFLTSLALFYILYIKNSLNLFPPMFMLIMGFYVLLLSISINYELRNLGLILFLSGVFLFFIKQKVYIISFTLFGVIMLLYGFYLKQNKNDYTNKRKINVIDEIRDNLLLISKDIVLPPAIGLTWSLTTFIGYLIYHLFKIKILKITNFEFWLVLFILFLISALTELVSSINSLKKQNLSLSKRIINSFFIFETLIIILNIIFSVILLKINASIYIPAVIMLLISGYFIVTSQMFFVDFYIYAILLFIAGTISLFFPYYLLRINIFCFSIIMFLWGFLKIIKKGKVNVKTI